MTEIIFTRHGQTEWNIAKKMQGQKDSPLTETGLMQASVLGSYLRGYGITSIYTSTLPRALRTATIIQKEIGLEIIHKTDELKEIYLAKLEGVQFSKAKEEYPEQMHNFTYEPTLFLPVGDGETFFEAQKRALDFVLPLINKHQGEKILIVTHAVIIRLLMSFFESIPMDDYWKMHGFFFPCSLSTIQIDKGVYTTLLRNSIDYAAMELS